MIEIEAKYRVEDAAALSQRILQLGGRLDGPPVRHEDTFFRHPCRDFVVTGEAMRIRRVDGVGHVTYKGPKDPGDIKVRQELEWCLGADDPAGQRQEELWVRLGFEPVEVVRKTRQSHQLEGLTVTMDQLDDVGTFSEIESVIESRQQAAVRDARQRIAALADRLGLSRLEPRSYLTMTLEHSRR